jgi:hypothetical protein
VDVVGEPAVSSGGRIERGLVATGTALAVAGTLHAAWNLRVLRRPPTDPAPVDEAVSILLPVRDEAARVADCLRALLRQERLRDVEILVLDDGSTDGTADVVQAVLRESHEHSAHVRLLSGGALPDGWLGKPNACAQLADAARGSVLVFVDADVVLAPVAVAATVTVLRESGLDLVSPYPRQIAETPAERLVQPLLQWSWLTFLPLRAAEISPRESLVAANGQLLAVDTAVYRRAGGHGAVRTEVLDDVALLRAVKRAGGTGVVVDGTDLADCRMYESWTDVRDGYTKSLWSAFGSKPGTVSVTGLLALAYVVPPAAAVLRGSRTGALGYAAAVLGRVLVARRVGARVLPDVLAHPASVGVFGWLSWASWRRREAGSLQWKGRTLP